MCLIMRGNGWRKRGEGSGSTKRMPGDLCVIAVYEIGLYAPCPSFQIHHCCNVFCVVFLYESVHSRTVCDGFFWHCLNKIFYLLPGHVLSYYLVLSCLLACLFTPSYNQQHKYELSSFSVLHAAFFISSTVLYFVQEALKLNVCIMQPHITALY